MDDHPNRADRAPRALLCTNHLTLWSGSEIVVLELAESLRARGWEVEVFTNLVTRNLAPAFKAAGVKVGVEPKNVRAFDHDLVWIQHHTAPLLDYSLGPEARRATRFVFAHLSSFTEFEMPGLVAEGLLADLVLCNSPETESAAIGEDLAHLPRRLFANPAPAAFAAVRRSQAPAMPRRIVAISNHLPPEVADALALVRQRTGAECVVIGKEGDLYGRVTPALLATFDVVVTMGKSVQYALAAGIPVYCYDRFGGPGYLVEDNFERAAQFNFSGRCTRTKRSAEALAQDLVDHFARGLARARQPVDPRFLLEPQLDAILSVEVRDNASKAARLAEHANRVMREAQMARLIRRYFRAAPGPWQKLA